ncbi:regulating synaptic membrane exocytosis protein 2-like isoform X1 [Procambarus clarkii]|uniref:regulating synaptic membrane exocytosis protein 2-like isoform X1 n=1 Tax=Procambarus clarkii TaxID=6728 RepID=UPI003743BF5D
MAADGGPDIMPDLSHLTEEERSIIEGVMRRQKIEEERENELVRRKQDEVRVLEDTIRLRSEVQRKKGLELEATCQICLKTKFADGVGHMCNYCNVRCCARCGGKVSLRSNKVIWVCILCRKKQELLIKTGTWMNTGLSQHGEMMHLDHDFSGTPAPVTPTADKRPKLERGLSADDNRPASVQGLVGPASGGHHNQGEAGPHHYQGEAGPHHYQGEAGPHHYQGDPAQHHPTLESRPLLQRSGSAQGRELRRQFSQGRGGGESGRPARGRAVSEGGEEPPSPHARDRPVPPPEAFRTCEHPAPFEQRAAGPDIRVERGSGGPGYSPACHSPGVGGAGGSSPMEGSSPGPASMEGSSPHPDDPRRMHLDPAAALERSRGRRRTDPVMRNDSLSSDQSECVRPPPPKPHKHRTRGRKQRQRSLSSSDEEVRSTPECTSCEEHEAESESVSEKGEGEAVAERWKREEILDAKIKKFLAVSLPVPSHLPTFSFFFSLSPPFRCLWHLFSSSLIQPQAPPFPFSLLFCVGVLHEE